jgi:hypothetical protein
MKKILLFLSIFAIVGLACDLSVTVEPSNSPAPPAHEHRGPSIGDPHPNSGCRHSYSGDIIPRSNSHRAGIIPSGSGSICRSLERRFAAGVNLRGARQSISARRRTKCRPVGCDSRSHTTQTGRVPSTRKIPPAADLRLLGIRVRRTVSRCI